MFRIHGRLQRTLLLLLTAAAIPCGAGCAAVCFSEAGWVCGPGADFGGQYTLHSVSRNDKPDLLLFAKLPTSESNGKALLIAHTSSDNTREAALLAVVQWGSVFAGDGYTVVAHAYDEADSAYGQNDLADTLEAIDWLNGPGGEELGVDQVYLHGTSRGGIIAYQTAYRCEPEKLAGVVADRGVSNFLLLDGNYEAYLQGLFGSTIQRAVQLTLEWIGVLPEEDPEPWKRLSAGYNIERIRVPLLVLHGDRDFVVPFEQALDFRERVLQAGRSDIEFYLVEGRGHFSLGFDPDYREIIRDFLERH